MKAAWLALWFLVLPFVIGAAFHFFGAWLGIPCLFVLGIIWVGVCIEIYEVGKAGDL